MSAAPAIKLNWEQLLERIEQEHPSMAPFLAQGTLVKTEGERVILGYPRGSVAFTRIGNEETRRVVARVCAELAGRPVQVQVVELAEGQTAPPSMAQTRQVREREQKQALLEKTRANPLVKQALATFGSDVVEVRQGVPKKESEA